MLLFIANGEGRLRTSAAVWPEIYVRLYICMYLSGSCAQVWVGRGSNIPILVSNIPIVLGSVRSVEAHVVIDSMVNMSRSSAALVKPPSKE